MTLKNPIVQAWRGLRGILSTALSLAPVLILPLGLAGCAPQTAAQLPPATSLAVTAAPPATAAPPTLAPQPTATVQPTQATQPVDDGDLLVTILHTNDVAGETDPCG